MKKIVLLALAMFLYWVPANANALRVWNYTCSDFHLMIYSNSLYGYVTVPAHDGTNPGLLNYNEFGEFWSQAENAGGGTYDPQQPQDFTGLRGWDVSPMYNSFFIFGTSPNSAGWVLPCASSSPSFNVVSNFPGTAVDVFIMP